MDFYHTGFVNPERNARARQARPPSASSPSAGSTRGCPTPSRRSSARSPSSACGASSGTRPSGAASRAAGRPTTRWSSRSTRSASSSACKNMHFHKGPAVEPLALEQLRRARHRRAGVAVPGAELHHRPLRRSAARRLLLDRRPLPQRLRLAGGGAGLHPQPAALVRRRHGQPAVLARARTGSSTAPTSRSGTPTGSSTTSWPSSCPRTCKQEYGVDLTPEIKQKIVGGNIARLYGIDIEAKLEAIEDDEFARRRTEYLAGQPAVEPTEPPAPSSPRSTPAWPGPSRGDRR